MVDVCEKLEELTVVKRNGKKVDFDETKIALAIKKGFDSVEVDIDEDEKMRKYTSRDVQKVYQAVLKKIEKLTIKKEKLNKKQYINLKQINTNKKHQSSCVLKIIKK